MTREDRKAFFAYAGFPECTNLPNTHETQTKEKQSHIAKYANSLHIRLANALKMDYNGFNTRYLKAHGRC